MNEGLTDIRKIIEYFSKKGQLLTIDKEIDPVYDLAGFIAAMEGGPVLLFNNIKGHPGHRVVSNLLGTRERLADVLRASSLEYTGKAFLEYVNNPIPPEEVSTAPCQQNVFTENLDIAGTIPVPIQTPRDAGPIINSGMILVKVPESDTFNLSFHRLSLVGKDCLSVALSEIRHLTEIVLKARRAGKDLPVTVNIGGGIGAPIVAGGGTASSLTPTGYDELGLIGAIEGSPLKIVPAKTVDGAWSLASAEIVLEGYIARDIVYEGSLQDGEERMLMGESSGVMGYVGRTPKFQVTAITHRDQPVSDFPLAPSLYVTNMMAVCAEANAYAACKKINPDVFDTCYVLPGMRGLRGLVIRLRKRGQRDDGIQGNMLLAAAASSGDFRWVIAVDHDVNITDPDDVWEAVINRVDVRNDIYVIPAGIGASRTGTSALVDATVPATARKNYERPRFPKVNLQNWLSQEQLADIKAKQRLVGHATTLANLALNKDGDWSSLMQPYPTEEA